MNRISIFFVVFVCLTAQSFAQNKMATVTDSRDGQVYKTIEIAGKTWMSQNLNFLTRNSWCYQNTDNNCLKYGRLYSWFATMNGQAKSNSQGICMNGWHVPSVSEWNAVIDEYDVTKKLLVGGTSGFNMIMSGCRFANGTFDFENKAATYWSSTADSINTQFANSFYGYYDQKSEPMKNYSTGKTYGLSVRCVKN